jgi:RES domain-containing protein
MSDYTNLNPTADAEALSDAEYQRVEVLCLCLDTDIESWFNASIACCDSCLDDYIASWPRAYRNDSTFHENTREADNFYDGSRRVQEQFTKADFERLLPYVACPRCSRSIGTTFYSYELPFDIPPKWQAKERALAMRASKTPFLLLKDPFARRIYANIQEICKGITRSVLPAEMFRGRSSPASLTESEFFPPPPAVTREGRYNHAGIPILYLASDKITCWRECREPSKQFYVSRIEIERPMRILDLVKSEELESDLQALIYSSLMSAPSTNSGWHQPQYVLTRFVADCVRSAGISGILYPSAMGGDGVNIAVLDVENCEAWIKVRDIRLYSGRKYSL